MELLLNPPVRMVEVSNHSMDATKIGFHKRQNNPSMTMLFLSVVFSTMLLGVVNDSDQIGDWLTDLCVLLW